MRAMIALKILAISFLSLAAAAVAAEERLVIADFSTGAGEKGVDLA